MLDALFKRLTAAVEGVIEFFRVLPEALGAGAADTMAAHGRDPNAGMSLDLDFTGGSDGRKMTIGLDRISMFVSPVDGRPY